MISTLPARQRSTVPLSTGQALAEIPHMGLRWVSGKDTPKQWLGREILKMWPVRKDRNNNLKKRRGD